MTTPQKKMLEEVRKAGQKTYNGRARRTVEALRDAGLVNVEYKQIPQAKGNGIEIAERFVVTPR